MSVQSSMPQAAHCLSPCDTGDNNGRPPPLDFRRRRELNWDHIEMEIHSIARRAMAVEIIGRSAQENVHGESLGEVFEFLANDMRGDIERLKELLGIGRESEGGPQS